MSDNRALNVTGVTWLDWNDDLGRGKQSLAQIVHQVVAYHKRRLGEAPNLIQVHPSVVPEPQLVHGIWVDPQRHILKQHYHAVRVDESKLPSEEPPEDGGETGLVLEIVVGG